MPDKRFSARLLNRGKGVPHKRQDCVALLINGERVAYTCYYHLMQSISLLECDYPDAEISIYGIPRAHDRDCKCWLVVEGH